MKSVTEIRQAINSYLCEINKMFLETRISLLIPSKNQTETAFIFAELRSGEENKIGCPTAIVVCDSKNASVISFKEIDLSDEATYLGNYQATLTIAQQRSLFCRLLVVYEHIREISFIEKQSLSKTDVIMLNEYAEIFNKLIPDCLKKVYFDIGSDFFQWLNQ